MSDQSAEKAITIPRPQIHTGPKHQTVDEATTAYLREAADRVRKNRYWGSGVSHLVATVLDDAANAMSAPLALLPNACKCGECYHPAFGPDTDGEPCDWCQDCGCGKNWHLAWHASTPPESRAT